MARLAEHSCSANSTALDSEELTPESAKEGSRGGGQNLTMRPATENSFRPPSPRYVLPLPCHFPLEVPRISLRWSLSETALGRVSTNIFQLVILARFCLLSETGGIRFRRARFQTLNSVSLFALPELQGGNSVSYF